MKNNNKIIWLLGIILLGVWGTILYQVYERFYGYDPTGDENISISDTRTVSSMEKYVYEANIRDPFRFSVEPMQKPMKKKESATPVPVWVPPPLKLTGIVRNNSRTSAIIETSDGATHFLHEGDTLAGMVVLKIKDRLVAYKFNGKAGEWVMDN